MLPALSVNKGYCNSQVTIAIPDSEPWGKLRMETGAAHCQALSHCSHPQLCTPREFRLERRSILAPYSQDAYQKDDFHEPKLLHLPIHRKELSYLTWDVWFSLTVKRSEVAQLCPTLCDPMDCSLPGSSVHWIFQARILEWVAISFSLTVIFSNSELPGFCCKNSCISIIGYINTPPLPLWSSLSELRGCEA